jgi:hypothetical protein
LAHRFRANLLVGWLADVFRAAAVAQPITKAAMIGMLPWLLAIPCFYVAARYASTELARH